jgi:hypothetical protein
MKLITVISTQFDKSKRRIIKSLGFGKSDAQTSFELSPFGIDSNPLKGMVALYGVSADKSKTFIIGYINKNQVAAVGEIRLFSTDAVGTEKMYQWLKNDGTMEIGGNDDHMVRFSELEKGFNEFKTDFNNFLILYNSHTHSGVTSGFAVSGPTPSQGTASTASIAAAKINEIKTLK